MLYVNDRLNIYIKCYTNKLVVWIFGKKEGSKLCILGYNFGLNKENYLKLINNKLINSLVTIYKIKPSIEYRFHWKIIY